MNTQQIKELLDRLRAKKAKYYYNSNEGEDGTFWIANLEAIEPLDLILIKTYEYEIKQYFLYNTRDFL